MAENSRIAICCILLAPIFAVNVLAQETPNCAPNRDAKFLANSIQVQPKPIFDESAEDTIALHRWANSLHIITKPDVILERLPFEQGDKVSMQDIVEAEAILRGQRYLANAEITATPDCATQTVDLKVTTWDNWSLIPTISFSRSGGESKTLLGVRDDNLLGLGIRATARYSEDEQRSGYQFAVKAPVPGIKHADLSLKLADNDDGEVYQVKFDKPFYYLHTPNRILAAAKSVKLTEDIFQNDLTRNSFIQDSKEATFAYGWNLGGGKHSSKRITLGATVEKADFAIAEESPSSDPALLPDDRDFLFPWLGIDYVQRDIVVMEDIYLINQPEDINLGWQFSSKLGIEADNDDSGLGLHSQLSAGKGFAFDKSLFMLEAKWRAISNAGVKDYSRLDASAEYFYRSSELVGYFAKVAATFSTGQFLDRPIVIDDENGVRGFPKQYQHGDDRMAATAEVRWYTDYNIYQLFEVGFAGFIDVGRASGGNLAALNLDDGWLSSVGFGARLYSNKASQSGVVHIDIAKPISDQDGINGWEWSLQLRRSF